MKATKAKRAKFLTGMVAMSLLGGLSAQKGLNEAIVAEEMEHDLGRAAKMYRALAEDEANPQEMRSEALLRLSKVLRRSGDVVKAKEALEEAAKGSGPAAKLAADILSGKVQDGSDLVKLKVEQALKELRNGTKSAESDLAWIGQPAVPFIIQAVQKEKADLKFITRAAGVLFKLGGPKVIAWIDQLLVSPDVLRKRAVIKGIVQIATWKAIYQKLTGLLSDKDPAVRRDAVQALVFNTPVERLLGLLQDEDAEVQSAAWRVVSNYWVLLRHNGKEEATLRRLLPLWKAKESGPTHSLAGYLSSPSSPLSKTTQGRQLFFELLKLPRPCDLWWPELDRGEELGASVYATDILESARVHGPYLHHGGRNQQEVVKSSAQRSLGSALKDCLKYWKKEATPAVLELLALGYDRPAEIGQWLVRHADASAVPEVARNLDKIGNPSMILEWMEEKGIANAQLPALKSWIEAEIRDRQGRLPSSSALCAIASIGSDDSIAYLEELARRGYEADVFNALMKSTKEGYLAGLRRFLVMPGSDENTKKIRTEAFTVLASAGDMKAVELYPKAFELGLRGSGVSVQQSVLAHLFPTRRSRVGPANDAERQANPYDDKTSARIVDLCLATGNWLAYSDFGNHVMGRMLPESVIKVAYNRALACPVGEDPRRSLRLLFVDRLLALAYHPQAAATLFKKGLMDSSAKIRVGLAQKADLEGLLQDAEIVRILEARLDDPEPNVVSWAAVRLASVNNKTVFQKIDSLIGHKSPDVRTRAAEIWLEHKGADGIEKVGSLVNDKVISTNGRKRIASKIGAFMDARAVPFLLEALKDNILRETAEKMLKSIRFYNQEKQLWKRLMDGTGLETSTAAETLVKQLRESKDKEVRLTAIASLGTLAVPETLPILIQLMSDADPEIAKAAKAAAAKINARTPAPKK